MLMTLLGDMVSFPAKNLFGGPEIRPFRKVKHPKKKKISICFIWNSRVTTYKCQLGKTKVHKNVFGTINQQSTNQVMSAYLLHIDQNIENASMYLVCSYNDRAVARCKKVVETTVKNTQGRHLRSARDRAR